MSDPGTATSEERMRSHVPDAIGPMFRILRLSVVWRGRLGRELAELGAGVANMRRLARLTFLFEDATQRELAVAMDIDTSALAKLLELLEKADYIRRKLDPTDRRLKRIFLTDGGRVAWETYKQTTSKLETNMTAGLDRGVRSHTGRNRRCYPERRTPAMRRIGAAADSKGYQRCTTTLRNYPALGAGVVM